MNNIEIKDKRKEYLKEYSKLYYLKNKEKLNSRNKEYKKNNRKKINELNKKDYEKNKEKRLGWHKVNYKENKELILLKSKERNDKYSDSLSDAYIKGQLRCVGFKNNQITPELIELKRITLKTKRLCRQLKN